jgi:hypothetical protein
MTLRNRTKSQALGKCVNFVAVQIFRIQNINVAAVRGFSLVLGFDGSEL